MQNLIRFIYKFMLVVFPITVFYSDIFPAVQYLNLARYLLCLHTYHHYYKIIFLFIIKLLSLNYYHINEVIYGITIWSRVSPL